MILYLDTSALVKLFINESNSALVRQYYHEAEFISTSIIAYVEFNSAISRLSKEGLIKIDELDSLKRNFEYFWGFIKVIELDKNIIKSATELLYQTELRAFDSVHLASARYFHDKIQKDLIFGCFDKRLINGAKLIGLNIFN